jgi:hypothetical protein
MAPAPAAALSAVAPAPADALSNSHWRSVNTLSKSYGVRRCALSNSAASVDALSSNLPRRGFDNSAHSTAHTPGKRIQLPHAGGLYFNPHRARHGTSALTIPVQLCYQSAMALLPRTVLACSETATSCVVSIWPGCPRFVAFYLGCRHTL